MNKSIESPSRADALINAFFWTESKEGWAYWASIYNEFLRAEGREEEQVGLL